MSIQARIRISGAALTLAFLLPLSGCGPVQRNAPAAATAPAAQPSSNTLSTATNQAPSTAQQPVQSNSQVSQLIASVEQSLARGQASYRQGRLTDAKRDFDSAVDQMLASGIDIRATAALQDEYNRVLDTVNGLEMEALKQGNGFAPVEEPTPADVANDVTFAVDPNLVAKAQANLATTRSDLPLVINDYVAAYINFFANTKIGHNTLKHSLERGGKYKAMIQRVMTEEGVPQDLIYLAVAESGFQPQVVNRGSGAGGMWQFMPHGDYGLTRNSFVDERFDPEKSTRAYARYLKFLYDQLGDWYLAMAGYDWGAGNVQRAVQKTGYADYWELYKRNNLPGETKNYVPEILAAIIIAKNLKQYGFDDISPDPAVVTDTVPINYAVDLRLAADIVNADPRELLALNPSLLRMTTPPSGMLSAPFALHLPPGTATLFAQKIVRIPVERRTYWRYHRVTAEDSLVSVARNYHVSVEELAKVNDLRAGDTLENVDALVIPAAPVAPPRSRTTFYRAHRGDTLVTVADRFGVSLADLRRWNHISGNTLKAGQRVRVSEAAPAAPASKYVSKHASTSGLHSAVSNPRERATAAPTKAKSPSQSGSAKNNFSPASSQSKRAATNSTHTIPSHNAPKSAASKKSGPKQNSTKKKKNQK